MKLPKRLERRRRTYNIIKKRWGFLMSRMQPMGAETREEAQSLQTFTPHYLHKYNLDCGCRACKANKYYGKYKQDKYGKKKREENI